jgi:hypothetical protein
MASLAMTKNISQSVEVAGEPGSMAGAAAGAHGSAGKAAVPDHPERAVGNLPPARDPVNRVAAAHTPGRLA